MELRYLEIFCKVVDLKSFSKAAEALFLTQPTISNHIKAIEDEVGIQLLDRLGRNVTPTKAGEVLYRYAREIVNLKKNAMESLNEFRGTVRGKLTIGGSTIPGEYILPEYIARFKKAHTGVTVTLKISDSQGAINMLMNGEIEMGVVGSMPDDKRIDSKEFLNDELVLVAAMGHFKDLKKEISVRELKKLPFIIREQGSGSRKTLEEDLKKHNINLEDLNITAEVGSTEAVKQSVKTGIGVSFLSRFAVKDELPGKTLTGITVKGLNTSRHFYIVTCRARAISPICQTFMKNLLTPLRPT